MIRTDQQFGLRDHETSITLFSIFGKILHLNGPNQILLQVLCFLAASTNHLNAASFGPGCCRINFYFIIVSYLSQLTQPSCHHKWTCLNQFLPIICCLADTGFCQNKVNYRQQIINAFMAKLFKTLYLYHSKLCNAKLH